MTSDTVSRGREDFDAAPVQIRLGEAQKWLIEGPPQNTLLVVISFVVFKVKGGIIGELKVGLISYLFFSFFSTYQHSQVSGAVGS